MLEILFSCKFRTLFSFVHVCLCARTHTYAHTHARTHVHTCARARTHRQTDRHRHRHIHTHTHLDDGDMVGRLVFRCHPKGVTDFRDDFGNYWCRILQATCKQRRSKKSLRPYAHKNIPESHGQYAMSAATISSAQGEVTC